MPKGNPQYEVSKVVRFPEQDIKQLKSLSQGDTLSQAIRDAVKFYLAAMDTELKREGTQNV